ncbi:MAG: DNA-directed DNA polymerase eta rad30 [Thelocarpon superellum]|nr:MAG: DNA-directed DNA polymerase eta rad30 [Thelocarpon superellum]
MHMGPSNAPHVTLAESSSSERFVLSSSLDSNDGSSRRPSRSRFTYRQLAQLGASQTSCPLRVIALIDMDCFYAQCEQIRLGLPEDQPLAVQQWQGLIAINYPARAFGLSRHIDIAEAKKLCPELIMQHVATWKEGEDKWAYHDDASAHLATHKVSLDPYRLQSRKILAMIKDTLPPSPMQRVEKASIDEVFLDLSAQVHAILLQRYPELMAPAPYDDPTEALPRPPTTALDWNTDALVDLDDKESEHDDPDWDDIAMLIGSEIVRSVRAAVRTQLQYTCSAGIAQNKMLAKLGAGHRKPNQQTIVRNRAIQQFLSGFKFTKIRNLGGKLGDQLVASCHTDAVRDLLEVPLDRLKQLLGEDTATWVHHVIRGIDLSEVSARTQIKSMLSAKSFRPTIATDEQAVRWIRIFVADIFSRLVEEGVLEHKRRPKTINLHYRHSGQTRSRQGPIPHGRPIDEAMLFDLAVSLLRQIIAEGHVWPCANLSLSVGGFEDGVVGTQGIGSFLVKGDEAISMLAASRHDEPGLSDPIESHKRRRLDHGGIQRFLVQQSESVEPADEDPSVVLGVETDPAGAPGGPPPREDGGERLHVRPADPLLTRQPSITSYFCDQCKRSIGAADKEEHDDWHFAKDLQKKERTTVHAAGAMSHSSLTNARPKSKADSVGHGRGEASKKAKILSSSTALPSGRVEKGQRKLAFGR